MLIALVADVHGNLPALEAVLADAETAGADAVWHAGDAVGYGPFPGEVVELLDERAEVAVLGDYDRDVLSVPRRSRELEVANGPLKWPALRWAWERLAPSQRELLASFPERSEKVAGARRALVVHGSPLGIDDRLETDASGNRLRRLAAAARADLVITGHTHRRHDLEAAGTRFVNPGAVGRQVDGDPRASYALVEIGETVGAVEFRRIGYDVARAVEPLEETGLPRAYAAMIASGRTLDEVVDARG